MHQFTNKLIDETSPYLLQHAHNPVNWFPWGDEALNQAKKENKPILVSIGYSACHWCHGRAGPPPRPPDLARDHARRGHPPVGGGGLPQDAPQVTGAATVVIPAVK